MPYILCCGYALTQLRGMSRQTKSAFFTQVPTAFVITIEPARGTHDAKKRPLAPGLRPRPGQCFRPRL
jgi:hypothetical protein